jgi:dTDP-4-dehydrorhamnose reductase
MRILVTGGNGQLGTECQLSQPSWAEAIFLDRPEFDLTNSRQVREAVQRFRPGVVLHLGAWTDVDGAETNRENAFMVNHHGTSVLAEAVSGIKGRLIYISTDYVFSPEGGPEEWKEEDVPSPCNAYGESKLAGEQVVRQVLGEKAHIVRTSWLYGRKGKNFPKTMASMMRKGENLRVVDDQIGCPTWAGGLAKGLWVLSEAGSSAPPILHYSDGPPTTWFKFAEYVKERLSLAEAIKGRLDPCATSDFPTPATRPLRSTLYYSDFWSEKGCPQANWKETLAHQLPTVLRFDSKTCPRISSSLPT